jgi:hypothetical protein
MKTFLLLSTMLLTTAAFGEPALTIYNQNFGVIRETLPLDLKAGRNEAQFAGVTAQLEPDSVVLRDPSGRAAFQILEQSYRNDPVSEAMLLSIFEGEMIDFVQREPQKPDRTVRGRIIRSGFVPGGQPVQPIIQVDDQLQFNLPGSPRFPKLGDETILKPALSWKIASSAAVKFYAELAYISAGLNWLASYNIVAPENTEEIDLVGWVTMTNQSGTTFRDARVKLMAGDVHKIQPAPSLSSRTREAKQMFTFAAESAPAVTEKSFDEFHLYTLANSTTLRDKETKQVEFVRAAGIKASRVYVYDGAAIPGWRVGMTFGGDPGYGVQSNKKVAVYREFRNTKENHLGIALPAGRVRFYAREETDASLQFVGENMLDHTPKDELIRVYVANSFDLVGERKRTDFKVSESNHWADESFEIRVRNRKEEPVEIRVVEHLYRWVNWELTAKSADFQKKDAQTIEFNVPLQPNEEKVLTYKVHYTW